MYLTINNSKFKIAEMNTFWLKLKGLMGLKKTIDKAYLFKKTNSIHTFFMKQNIDVCITDKNNKILYVRENMLKNRIILPIKKGYNTYELPLDTVKYLKINDYLKIDNL